jgi:predicted class III extradiol MEMO1 family dioxygenase
MPSPTKFTVTSSAAADLWLQDWQTPLGTAHVDTSAVDYLSQQHHLPINEAPHNSEHAIENQLPFLLHGASCGWDLAAAGCSSGVQPGTLTPAAAAAAATLSIVPVSIGYLGNQLPMIQSVGAAVRDVMQHLKQQQSQANTNSSSSSSSSGGGSEVVLIVTSDFTHAGPWYRELPPAGVSLEEYMRMQDTPVLQVWV